MSTQNFRDLAFGLVGFWLVYKIYARIRRNAFVTRLRGPPSDSWLFGVTDRIINGENPGEVFEDWAEKYGSVYSIPRGLGSSRIVLCDSKALAHFHTKDTFTFQQSPAGIAFFDRLMGKGILNAQGEDHRRQRRALTPAFSNSNLRKLTNVFFDSGYKVKNHWENILQEKSSDGLIDVQEWMNHVALDSIGLAGFSHDFNSLDGEKSGLLDALEMFISNPDSKFQQLVLTLMQVFPMATKLPTTRSNMAANFKGHASGVAHELLARTRKEKEGFDIVDNSIIGLLVKSENAGSKELRTTPEEVMAQMNTLVIAGFETSSISLTWALIELCKHPKAQTKLREELSKFQNQDPTWDDLMSQLPYLDACVQETLRLHPAALETQRVATEDDIIPLSQPILTRDGKETSAISIMKGDHVTMPIVCINRSKAFWGPTAKEFIPERWLNLDGSDVKAKEILGYRHILTFSDGPRICLGKNFALAEMRSVLSVLIRNFSFDLPNGPDTEIELHQGIGRRPKVKGMTGAQVPLKVTKVEY